MGDLRRVDPVGVSRTFLLAQDDVLAAFGGPDRFDPYNEPPYPRCVLSDPPGNDRDLTHLLAPFLQIEVLGDPDGSPGKPVLRDLLYLVLMALKRMPEQTYGPDDTVVTNVGSTGGGGWAPLPNGSPAGQPRYIATLQLHAHPPRITTSP